jgi:hypothetical protein
MSEWVPALITGGLGAAVGSIGTALIQTLSGRGVSRAEAADRVTNAAGNLADRLDRMNTTLERENIAMRKAVVALTDVMDEVIPLIPDAAIRTKAHDAIKIARLALR